MIKVKNTELINDISCVKGKLILLKDKMSLPKELDMVKDYASDVIKPFIISETEEIEIGDSLLINDIILECIGFNDLDDIECDNNLCYQKNKCKKILALPEHFSEELLLNISDGKLKNGDEIYVECNYYQDLGNLSGWNEIHLDNDDNISLVNIDSIEVTNLKSLMSKYTKEELEQITKFWEDYHKKNPEAYKALENDKDYSKEDSWENILQEYMKQHPSFSAPYPKFEDWLIEYYHPPIRK